MTNIDWLVEACPYFSTRDFQLRRCIGPWEHLKITSRKTKGTRFSVFYRYKCVRCVKTVIGNQIFTVLEIDRLRQLLFFSLLCSLPFARRSIGTTIHDPSVFQFYRGNSLEAIWICLFLSFSCARACVCVSEEHRGNGGPGMAWSVFTSSRVSRARFDSAIRSLRNGRRIGRRTKFPAQLRF